MPRPVAILTLEELAAKFEHAREKRRAANKFHENFMKSVHKVILELRYNLTGFLTKTVNL
jgi:hypothetical protein